MKSFLTLFWGFVVLLMGMTFLIPQSVWGAPVPDFPDFYDYKGVEMEKSGQDRYVYKFFFKLYDAVLYRQSGAETADILEAKAAFHLEFRYLREIEKSIILKSADAMLARNLTVEELSQIRERVERLNEAYASVEKGDRSSLTFRPGIGTTLLINGREKITIEGDDFARLYFSIWLGEQPISTELKSALLGSA